MPSSLTKDWEYKTIPLCNKLMKMVTDYEETKKHCTEYVGMGDVEGVESEEAYSKLYDELQCFLCDLLEAIEECSSFVADRDLASIVKELTERKNPAHLLAWAGMKITDYPKWTGD